MEKKTLGLGFRKANSEVLKKLFRGAKICLVHQPTYQHTEEFMSKDTNSLAQTTWNCKYHIVFAPKYRRQVIYGKTKKDIGEILRTLCERKGVEFHRSNSVKGSCTYACKYPTQNKCVCICRIFKGKSSLMIFDRHVNLKYRYGNRKFWCTGYYVDTVGRYKKVIEEYIRNQIQDDIVAEQLSMMEYIDLFTGEELQKRKRK